MLAAGVVRAAPDGDRSKKRKAKVTRTARAPRALGNPNAYYPNCTAARAAGVAPIRRGEPGYSAKLDRDDDGVACE